MNTPHAMVKPGYRRAVMLWLAGCALMVALMVMMGGYTRLTGSGLSITQWKPVHGVLPPLSGAGWQEEFAAYRSTPQYAMLNEGMDMAQFKSIFWPEFLHRLLGRVAGLVFFTPLAWFIYKRAITRRFSVRLAGIFVLGGLQGAMGWYMVKSGLLVGPYVSHIRLAIHLSLAFLILGLILWALLDAHSDTRSNQDGKVPRRVRNDYELWFLLLCFQIVLGALLAGLHGGLIYNTWPTMNGQWIPDGLAAGAWYDNLTLIQFMHRTTAVFLPLSFLFWWYCYRDYVKAGHLSKACTAVGLIIAAQFTLGVATLINRAPLPLALCHQLTGLLLFALAVGLLHGLQRVELRIG